MFRLRRCVRSRPADLNRIPHLIENKGDFGLTGDALSCQADGLRNLAGHQPDILVWSKRVGRGVNAEAAHYCLHVCFAARVAFCRSIGNLLEFSLVLSLDQ